MANERYGVMKAQQRNQLADIDLMTIPHKEKDLIVARFGQNWYAQNVKDMGEHYWNSNEFPNITFRPATTSESISATSYDFEKIAKPEIFDRWLQAGRVVRAPEWVVVNPPKDGKRAVCTDESELKGYLARAKECNGIWLVENDVELATKGIRDLVFVPYGFKQGLQTAREFAEGKLARGLEGTKGTATNLFNMALTYSGIEGNQVNVVYFDKSNEPIARVVVLGSSDDCLLVDSDWVDGDYGYAFGALDSEARSAEANAKK